MDSITELIRDEIKKKYSTMKKFSEASGIPYSTLTSAISKGIGGTSYDTVVKICKLLDIKQSYDSDIVLFNEQFHEIYTKLSALDNQGLHTVKTVLNVEYDRCKSNDSDAVVKAFNNIGLAVRETKQADMV